MFRPPPSCHARALPIALALALGCATAQAQDLTSLPLDKLLQMRVIAASSYEQVASEAPSSVSVITAEDIRRYGYRTLSEALQSLPGLFVTNDLSYDYLGSRGFNRLGDYNSRFQLSVNGLRTNDALYDMAYLGSEFPLDMTLIERIEFAPGPGSSIYGSNAMLGVINVVTRTGADVAGLRATLSVGSDGERSLGASFGKRYGNGLDILAGLSGLRTDGGDFYFPAFDSPGTNNGIAARQNGEKYQRGYFRARYAGFDLEVLAGQRDKRSPSVYYGSDFLTTGNLVDDFTLATLRYQHDLSDQTRLELRIFTGAYDYKGIYPGEGGTVNRDDAAGRWQGAEARVVSTRFARHKLVAGLEMQHDKKLSQFSADSNPDFVYLDRTDDGHRIAAYLQDEFRFAPGWLLNAGARYDRYDSFGSSVNPRVALVGEVAEGTTLKLLYGSAFRAPNAYELYYLDAASTANDRLGPEKLRSVEAVLERDRSGTLRWRASVFQYRFDDLIQQETEGEAFVFRNVGEVTGKGAEFSALASLPGDWRARASASYHDVRQQDGQRMTNSPRYTAKLGADAPIAATGLRLALDTVVVGDRLDRDRQPVGTAITTNLVASTHRPRLGALFSFGVYNLFDRDNQAATSDYFQQARVPGPGRTWRLEAQWRF